MKRSKKMQELLHRKKFRENTFDRNSLEEYHKQFPQKRRLSDEEVTSINNKVCHLADSNQIINDFYQIHSMMNQSLVKQYETYHQNIKENSLSILSKLNEYHQIIQDMMNHSKCSICMDYFNFPATISCGHTFCMECINEWKDIDKNNNEGNFTCPVCRYLNSNYITKNIYICDIISKLKNFLSI